MEGRNIQRASQIKVLKYLEYMNSQEEERNYLYKGELILNGISKHLREEVQQDFYGKILANSVIFKNIFTSKLIEQLSLLMKEVTLGPGDIIFNEGDIDNRLYYVFKGQVENTLELDHKIGDFFGQAGFFSDTPRQFTAKSKGTTHIVYCKRDDMLNLIKENPVDLEAFQMIKDDILFKENICGHKCLSCLKQGHIESKCNYINIKINKSLLFLKNNYSVDQLRNKVFERSKTVKFNAVTSFKYTRNLVKQLRVACVLEAVEYWDDIAILQDQKITDKEFFMRLPKIKVSEHGQLIQETDDSLFSDDDEMQFFSKEDVKASQDIVSGLSNQNIPPPGQQGQMNQKSQRNLRINTKHQTHKISIQHEEIDRIDVSRSKTKKDTYSFNSPSTKRYQIDPPQQSSLTNIAFPANQQDIFQRQNSQQTTKTHRTQQRHDSNTSLNSYHEQFRRNASRNLSHFGTAAVTTTNINLNLVSATINAKNDLSDSRIESPRQRSNLSAFNPKNQDLRLEQYHHSKQLTQQDKYEQQEQNVQFESYFNQYDIEIDFDSMKEYVIYYPQNNLTQVIRQIKKNWIDKFSKKRWKTKNSYKTLQQSKSNHNKLNKSETKNTQKSFTKQEQSTNRYKVALQS